VSYRIVGVWVRRAARTRKPTTLDDAVISLGERSIEDASTCTRGDHVSLHYFASLDVTAPAQYSSLARLLPTVGVALLLVCVLCVLLVAESFGEPANTPRSGTQIDPPDHHTPIANHSSYHRLVHALCCLYGARQELRHCVCQVVEASNLHHDNRITPTKLYRLSKRIFALPIR
jgi:hypothetical protein